MGLFKQIVNGDESTDLIFEVVALLHSSTNPQVEQIMYVIQMWADHNRIQLDI